MSISFLSNSLHIEFTLFLILFIALGVLITFTLFFLSIFNDVDERSLIPVWAVPIKDSSELKNILPMHVNNNAVLVWMRLEDIIALLFNYSLRSILKAQNGGSFSFYFVCSDVEDVLVVFDTFGYFTLDENLKSQGLGFVRVDIFNRISGQNETIYKD